MQMKKKEEETGKYRSEDDEVLQTGQKKSLSGLHISIRNCS